MSSEIKKRIIIFVSSIVLSFLFLAPTLSNGKLNSTNWFSKPLALGLDLSGGVHLVYEVQTNEAVKSRLQSTLNSLRSSLRADKIAIVRGKVNDKDQIEFSLLSDAFTEKTQKLIEDNFKEVSIVEKTKEDGKSRFLLGINPAQVERIKSESVNQAIETLRERVDQFGVAEAAIKKVGINRIMLQMPGVSDIEAVKKVVGSVAKLEFRLLPVGGADTRTISLKNREGLPVIVEDEALMTGDSIDDARVEMMDGQVEVHLKLTSEGRRTFGRITTENVNRQLAIILDGVVYSSPNINEPITTGDARITGGFTMEEGRQLKIVLKAGALPAPLKVMEERTVGPTLGMESIKKGILAILFGFVAVILFMCFYYKKSGVVAVISLAVNMILIVGILSMFGATLTLPGLAGLALTIGMAVDSNVIIFERIKDELRIGATRDAAIRAGFDKALSAILDANLTSLLAASILYVFGTGPIRGFAVTLAIGVVTTVYCATFCSRLAFDYFELKGSKGLSI